MLDDMIPIIKNVGTLDGLKIYAISDIHYGSPQFRSADWDRFVKKILSEKNSYIIIAGDCMNNGLKTSVSNVYEETCRPREQKRWLVEQFRPLASRILCGTGGNHERRSGKDADDDPLYDVFCKLDIEDRYRENVCFVALRFGVDDNGDRDPSHRNLLTYTIAVTHGAGGGMLIGSGPNRDERFAMAVEGVDLFIFGHTHKPITFPLSKISFDLFHNRIVQRQFTVVIATSWLGYGGYPVQKLLPPTAFVDTEIILNGKHRSISVTQTNNCLTNS